MELETHQDAHPLRIRQQNWRLIMKMENLVSAALMSKMDYSEAEKVQVKLEFFKILTGLQLDHADEILELPISYVEKGQGFWSRSGEIT